LHAAAGSPVAATIGYIQKTPGTFAMIKIPGIARLSNRIVHRAELIVEQIYDPSDDIVPATGSIIPGRFDPTITAFYKFRRYLIRWIYSTVSGFDFATLVPPLNAKDPAG
jgi:hypothetical protein